MGTHRAQQLIQRRSLLGVTVFDAEKVGNRAKPRIQHHQRFAGQWGGGDIASFQQAAFGFGNMIAVKNPSPLSSTAFRCKHGLSRDCKIVFGISRQKAPIFQKLHLLKLDCKIAVYSPFKFRPSVIMRCQAVLSLLAILFFLIPSSTLDAQFDIYVADFNDVVKVDAEGNSSTFISGLSVAIDLTVDADGNFLVADNGTNEIRKFSPDGTDLGVFATMNSGVVAIDVDQDGNVYAGSDAAISVRKFDPDGNILMDIPVQGDVSDIIFGLDDTLYVSDLNGDEIWTFDTDGTNGQLFSSIEGPVYMAFSPNDDNLYVTQIIQDQISAVSPLGDDLGVFVSDGLDDPLAIAFDPSGNLYVGDNTQNNIRKYSPTGDDLGEFATGVTVPVGMIVISKIPPTVLGDVNLDGTVDLLDVAPFVDLLANGDFQPEADINQDGIVDLLDVAPFVDLLSGG